jgi:hypothetical protein
VQLELSERDAALLSYALRSRIEELTRELSRTEQHAVRHDLAELVIQLELISARLEEVRARQPAETSAASSR